MNEYYEIHAPAAPMYSAPAPMPPVAEPPKPKTPKKRTGLKIAALALCCALLGGIAGAGGAWLGFRYLEKPQQTQPVQQEVRFSTLLLGLREEQTLATTQVDTSKLMSAAEVYAANVNSTVGITTSITTNYWGFQTTSAASGSGFIITQDGYILTNYHVVEDSNSITVTMYNGTVYDAKLVGYDESLDTAVLKVEADDLAPVILGSSDQLNVGDSVVAIGNPLGELTFSLTAGAISALDREVTMSNNITMDLIQTDCAINSGNSGGALFNLYGEVIGITNAKYSGSGSEASIDNIGFAIPINDAMASAKSIIEKGYVSKPYIGVYLSDVSEELQSYGLPRGAAVAQVAADSPAEEAGLQPNDIITEVDGKEITSAGDLGDCVEAASVGDRMTLTVYRQGTAITLTLKVGEKSQSAAQEQTEQQPSQQYPSPYPGGFGFGG